MDELNSQSASALAPDFKNGTGANVGAESSMVVDNVKTTPMQLTLARFIYRCYQENRDFAVEKGHHEQMRESWRMCRSEHDANDRAKLVALGIPADMFEPITEIKRQAAISQLKDIWNSPGDKMFTLSPTPVPEIPKYVTERMLNEMIQDLLKMVQETGVPPTEEVARKFGEDRIGELKNAENEYAKDQIELLESMVHDKMVEGDFIDVFATFVDHLTVFGTAFIEGPIPSVEYRNDYSDGEGSAIRRVPRRVLSFRAVNPLYVYPSRDQVGVEDGNICIRVKYPVHELWQQAKKAKEGDDDAANGRWFRETVRTFLSLHPTGGVHLDDGQDGETENREMSGQSGWKSDTSCVIEGINFYGKVKGNLLIQIGIAKDYDGKKIDEDDYYEINALVVGDSVFYCRISDPCIGRTLCKATFYDGIDAFYGTSIAQRLVSVQRVLNNCLKAIVANMGIIALPIYWVNGADRLIDKSPNALRMYAGKVIPFSSGILGQNNAPIGTIKADNNLDAIFNIYNQFIRRADDVSLIPAYTYGNTANSSGAARTYAGLSMLTEAANRGMKMVINSVDRCVIRKMVKRICDYLMIHDKNCPYRGDVNVNPSGVMSLILRENERQKVLQLMDMVTKNQMLVQTIGPAGIVEIFRQVLKSYDVDNQDKIVPSKKQVEIKQLLNDMQAAYQAQMAQGQAAQAMNGGQPQAAGAEPSPMGGNPPQPEPQEPTEGLEQSPNPGSANERRSAA